MVCLCGAGCALSQRLFCYAFWLGVGPVAQTVVLSWVTAPLAVVTGVIALSLMGVCGGRPMGLRVDRNGLSGYMMPPLEWSQVVAVGLHEMLKFESDGEGDAARLADQGHQFLGLRLYDPQAWWASNHG